MESAFGIGHPQKVSKASPRLRKVSKSLASGLFRGGASSAKTTNRALGGVRGVSTMKESEAAAYKATQLKRMKDSFTRGKEVAVRPKAGAPVSIRPKRPQLAIEGPKPGAPRNLPDVRRGPVTVPNRALARTSANRGLAVRPQPISRPGGSQRPSSGTGSQRPSSGTLVPTRIIPNAGGASGRAGMRDRLKGRISSMRGRLKRVRKPGDDTPKETRNITVSPLAATAVGAGVAGGGFLAGKGIGEGIQAARSNRKDRSK